MRRLLPVALALLVALAARADVRGVLHEPRAGEVLRGGTTATVSWSAPKLPRYVEEWEAFLSVDGGRYYAYRITPHLDIDRQSFAFEVPNVETDEARILIRAGDERREIEVETSATFVIRKDAALALAEPSLEVDEEERGEAAREGDEGVIEWIDGDRDGDEVEKRSALRLPCTVGAARIVVELTNPGEEPGVESFVLRFGRARLAPASVAVHARSTSLHRTGRELLLSSHRLNL